jgi:hypothetical protein
MKQIAILLTLIFFSFRLFALIALGQNILPLNLENGKMPTAQLQQLVNDNEHCH